MNNELLMRDIETLAEKDKDALEIVSGIANMVRIYACRKEQTEAKLRAEIEEISSRSRDEILEEISNEYCPSCEMLGEYINRCDDLFDELETANDRIGKLIKDNDTMCDKNIRLNEENEALRKELAEVTGDRDFYKANSEELLHQLCELRDRMSALKAKLWDLTADEGTRG